MLLNLFQEDNLSKGNKLLVIKQAFWRKNDSVSKNMLGCFFPTALDCSSERTVGQDLHLLFACAFHKES